ncbi:uncharacterized protein PHACADRAFT_262420 [Phanerochaete carnosa HHB-10118-sp]|uniref:Uncharacterized protein n=1 Tax=Phanerochaete carnosa (strain HHB-10118-sp) TaxID=650164 RepID=K5VZD7_PHACS|nr:uncharacterized protein PHACADRAFT_262420 [Phanerochaete carnosa HHB-10118-sp]EKM51979.1 hypothetical protein PHACADRAFT_262420 [Phanerochaete carnosa HHB-10118-sp]
MVQGAPKGLQNKKGQSSRQVAKAAAQTKKGKRYVAPKKTAAVKSAALHKELSAKINKSIEQQVAAAASTGKLTIMKNVAMEGLSEKDKAKVKK